MRKTSYCTLVVLWCLASGCRQDEQAEGGGFFRMAVSQPLTTLDPAQTVDAATLQLHLNTYSLLYRQRSDGRVEPSLVKDARSSEGGRRWDLRLRQGVHFCGTAGGREVTADDVVASLQRAANHPKSRVSWVFEQSVRREGRPAVEVTGPHGVRLAFEVPVDLPRYLTLPQLAVLPKEIAEDFDFDFGDSNYGSGPYRIESFDPDRIELISCEKPDVVPEVEAVRLEIIRDSAVALGRAVSGRLDAVELDFPQWQRFVESDEQPEEFRLLRVETPAQLEFLVLNTESEKLRSPRLRRALLYAIDRKALCEGPLLGSCSPTDFVAPLAGEAATNELYQPDLARAEWDSIAEKPRKVQILTTPDEYAVLQAKWAAAAWKRILNLDTEVRTLDVGPLLGTLFGGKPFEIAGLYVQPLADLPEIWYLAWQPGDLPPGGRNVSRLDNEQFRELFLNLQAGIPARASVLSRIEEALEKDPPAIPLLRRHRAWLIRDEYQWEVGPFIALEFWELKRTRGPG